MFTTSVMAGTLLIAVGAPMGDRAMPGADRALVAPQAVVALHDIMARQHLNWKLELTPAQREAFGRRLPEPLRQANDRLATALRERQSVDEATRDLEQLVEAYVESCRAVLLDFQFDIAIRAANQRYLHDGLRRKELPERLYLANPLLTEALDFSEAQQSRLDDDLSDWVGQKRDLTARHSAARNRLTARYQGRMEQVLTSAQQSAFRQLLGPPVPREVIRGSAGDERPGQPGRAVDHDPHDLVWQLQHTSSVLKASVLRRQLAEMARMGYRELPEEPAEAELRRFRSVTVADFEDVVSRAIWSSRFDDQLSLTVEQRAELDRQRRQLRAQAGNDRQVRAELTWQAMEILLPHQVTRLKQVVRQVILDVYEQPFGLLLEPIQIELELAEEQVSSLVELAVEYANELRQLESEHQAEVARMVDRADNNLKNHLSQRQRREYDRLIGDHIEFGDYESIMRELRDSIP